MQIDLRHPDFYNALPLLRQIEAAGFEAYFVGGSVRDALLGLPIHDVDIASSAYPEEIKQIFRKTVDTGIQHGTVMVLDHGTGYEVTTFRTESTYQDFRRPDHVTFVRSLEEDLKRRDFTVNALAVKQDGTVVDLFGGLEDLQARRLVAVGNAHDRFHEDALRMMRAVRFESQLDFAIEAQTEAAIAENAPLLEKISIERIASEFTRLLLGIARKAGVTTFLETGLFKYVPNLANEAADLRHFAGLPEAQLPDAESAWTLLATCLQVDAGKLLRDLKQANALINHVQHASALVGALPDASPLQLFDAGPEAVATAAVVQPYRHPDFDADGLLARYQALPIHSAKDLAISGQDLIKAGMTPGPLLGKTLRHLTEQVVAGRLENEATILLHAAFA
ncbi:CCA tRNA nucleotidyltransferase [Lacticaseibacillus yichunensis]|uniref:CCA-adding enzyme n=1 Tax=Lacticaseibacillus yichunensis TaxID=2486015 RepID=A0ABW4CT77_9LACO|nr:CCA tRNA nucleotidyltransferase [Lacticaseibacillus yichunensis]